MRESFSDLQTLLRSLHPALNQGTYAFVLVPPDADPASVPAIASFREKEGTTLILEENIAAHEGFTVLFRAAWITLTVHSDLDAVGLTAAVSAALASAGIACNAVAAACHDHIFVPVERAGDAMAVLAALQQDALRDAEAAIVPIPRT